MTEQNKSGQIGQPAACMIPNKGVSQQCAVNYHPALAMMNDTQPPFVWTVSALNKAIADSLKTRFSMISVQGELSGFAKASSGHCYFNLKDGSAQIRCALFRRTAEQLNFSPRDGQLVQAQARVAVYEPRGEMQLVIEAMRPAGAGQLHEAFLQLKSQLEAQGLFATDRKRAIPLQPQCIGVVTSLGAAALHDVVTTLSRRVPHIPVIISPSSVQGADAPAQLIQALQLLITKAQVEVILLVRGGGSAEDLWAFNDEHLAQAIVNSPIPIISGVGHEIDITIADLCADLRAPTPTAAAELCAVSRDSLVSDLDSIQVFFDAQLELTLDNQAQRLDRLQAVLARPSSWANKQQHLLSQSQSRLGRAAQQVLNRQGNGLQPQAQRLARAAKAVPDAMGQRLTRAGLLLGSLDPALVLQRGYAWLESVEGEAIASVKELQIGQQLRTRLADGTADMNVVSTQPASAP